MLLQLAGRLLVDVALHPGDGKALADRHVGLGLGQQWRNDNCIY